MIITPKESMELCNFIYNYDFEINKTIGPMAVAGAWRNDDYGHDFVLGSTDTDIILCIRGTNFNEMTDILTNIKIIPEEVTLNDGRKMKVHSGYHEGAIEIMKLMKTQLDALLLEKMRPIHITGHSLGGAIASLIALYLQDKGYKNISCRTFASPAIGNKSFRKIMEKEFPDFERYVYDLDYVPFMIFWYYHPSPSILIYKDGDTAIAEQNAWLTLCRIIIMFVSGDEKRQEAFHAHFPYVYLDAINLMKVNNE